MDIFMPMVIMDKRIVASVDNGAEMSMILWNLCQKLWLTSR